MKRKGNLLVTIVAGMVISTLVGATDVAAENKGSMSIPSDAVEYSGNYYKVYEDVIGTNLYGEDAFQEAEAYCEQMGGHLATITTQEENDFIYDYIVSQGVRSAYFGFTDQETDGIWKWVTGETVNYTNWSNGEPNGETSQEDYAMFYWKYTTGKWNDGNFGGSTVNGGRNFICEWEGSNSNTQFVKTVNVVIYENKQKQTDEAIEYCLSEGTEVQIDGKSYISEREGSIAFQSTDYKSAVFSKSGYSTRTISKERLEKSQKVYLQQTSTKPVINAVWIDDVDVMNEEYEISPTETEQKVLEAEIDWGNNQPGTVELVQKGIRQKFSGDSLQLVIKDRFDVTQSIYLHATDMQGNVTIRELRFVAENNVPDCLEGLKFSWESKIGLTLPEEIPFVGGKDIGVKLTDAFLPISVVVEENKVYATIGIDVLSYTKSDKYGSNSQTKSKAHVLKRETKNLFDNIKDAVSLQDTKKTLKKLKNIKSTYGTAMKYPQGSFGFSADFTILGYVEGYITKDNKLEISGGKVIFNPSVSSDWSGQFAIGPVPCYWEAQIKGEAEARLHVAVQQEKNLTPFGEADVTISGSVGAGVGLNKVATVGGGGTLAFKPYVQIKADPYFSMTTSVNAYFKAKLGIFEYKYDFPSIKDWFVEYPKASTKNYSSKMKKGFDYYDVDNYVLQDISYLDDKSYFMANSSKTENRKSKSLKQETTFLSNVYREAKPQVSRFGDGTKLAVWIDANNALINDLCLYYSYYDGSQWSEPAIIAQDGTPDFEPQVLVQNDIAYIVWQNAKREFAETDTLNTVSEDMGITVAAFDKTQQTFEVYDISKGVKGLHMMPKICGEAEKIAVVWLDNNENDWFGLNQNNIIYSNEFDGHNWSEPKAIYQGLNSISSFSAGYIDGELAVTYCEDQGNDLQARDSKIYINAEEIVSARGGSAPVICENSLYWYQDGTLMYRENAFDSNSKKITEKNVVKTDDYQIIDNGDKRVILYTASDGMKKELYGIFEENASGAWGEPVALTDNGKYINSYSAVWEGDSLEIFMESQLVGENDDDEPYGTADLLQLHIEPYCNVVLEEVDMENEKIAPQSTVEISLKLKNCGEKAGKFIVDVVNEEGTVIDSIESDDVLLSGTEQEVRYPYVVKVNQIGKKLSFEVRKSDDVEQDFSDKKKDIYLIYSDIGLENTGWGESADGEEYIYTSITNNGCQTEELISLSIYKDSPQGELVKTEKIDKLEPLESRQIIVNVPYDEKQVYYFVAEERSDEESVANNIDFVVLDKTVFTRENKKEIYDLKAYKEKKEYIVGDTFDIRDLKVIALFTDGTTEDVTNKAKIDSASIDITKVGRYLCAVSYGGKNVEFEVTVKNVEKPENVEKSENIEKQESIKKTISKLQINAKKGSKKIQITTIKRAKVKIQLNKKLFKKGGKKVRTVTISANKNKKGKITVRLTKKIPKKTRIKVTVSKAGYKTKKKTRKIK